MERTGLSLQIVSDLHLEVRRPDAIPGKEYYHYDITPSAPYLVLLGNIGCTVHDELFAWLEVQIDNFETVFFVAGNHEPYQGTFPASQARLKTFAEKHQHTGRFVLLDRTRHDMSPTVTILGCTLWSQVDPAEWEIMSWAVPDFRWIKDWSADACRAEHAADLAWLNGAVSDIAAREPHRTVLIFTHHVPAAEGMTGSAYYESPISSAFFTDLTKEPCWNKAVVRLWAFGHANPCLDTVHGGIRLYSNQRTYRPVQKAYNRTKVVVMLPAPEKNGRSAFPHFACHTTRLSDYCYGKY